MYEQLETAAEVTGARREEKEGDKMRRERMQGKREEGTYIPPFTGIQTPTVSTLKLCSER
jgi:hypothetical protein